MEKKLFILNPHRDDFIWEPLYYRVLKRRPLKKYHYIHDILLETGKVVLLIDDHCSGIFPAGILRRLPAFVRRTLIRMEMNRWMKINDLGSSVSVVWTHEAFPIGPQDNLLLFQLSNLEFLPGLSSLLTRFYHCYVHLSHYYLRPKRISDILKNIPNVVCCGDSDLSEHPFFRKYFPWYHQLFALVPFYVQDRFRANIPFDKKEDRVLSTGTFHLLENYPESSYVKDDWQVNAFHYNRRSIYENRTENEKNITCMNSPWLQKKSGWLTKLLNAQKVSQKKYFSVDIVEMYNRHRYALVGEEICGFPGIGSFEAMACGCVTLINPNTIKGICEENDCYLPFTEKVNDVDIPTLQRLIQDGKACSEKAIQFVNKNLRRDSCAEKFVRVFLQ